MCNTFLPSSNATITYHYIVVKSNIKNCLNSFARVTKTIMSTNEDKQPTLLDVFNLIKSCATKSDIEQLTQKVTTHTNETAKKFTKLNERVDQIASSSSMNTDRIEQLEVNVELLKQEQLKNNICISGIPSDITQSMDTAEIVIAIANSLGVQLVSSNFNAYTVANNKFIIVHMYNIKNKLLMVSNVRKKRALWLKKFLVQHIQTIVSFSTTT